MKTHPAAEIFPRMSDAEYAALKADVERHGIREPVWTYQGLLLDGRHRERACRELGIPCPTRECDGDDPVAFVVSVNLKRRHLNESQRAVVAARIANMPQGARTDLEPSANLRNVSQSEAAAILNVSERSVQDVKRLEREAPELLPRVESGELSLNAAVGEIKKRDRVVEINRQKQELARARPDAPLGVFHVIALDPPWPYHEEIDVTGYDPRGHRASNPYPEMELAEIAALKLPAADDCVLWLWTTHKFMRHAFPLLDRWGFTERAIVTWAKDRMGLGRWLRSQSEFASWRRAASRLSISRIKRRCCTGRCANTAASPTSSTRWSTRFVSAGSSITSRASSVRAGNSSEMTHSALPWAERPEVKKGNIGEALVDDYLLSKGIVPYRPIVSKAHPFDRLCASSDKRRIYVVEVKSKPKRERYPDTGIDWRHFQDYMNISMQHSMDVFIYFVDEVQKSIYGGELLGELARERVIHHEGKELPYPLKQSGIIYFPMCAMQHIAALPDDVCRELAALRRSNYGAQQGTLL